MCIQPYRASINFIEKGSLGKHRFTTHPEIWNQGAVQVELMGPPKVAIGVLVLAITKSRHPKAKEGHAGFSQLRTEFPGPILGKAGGCQIDLIS